MDWNLYKICSKHLDEELAISKILKLILLSWNMWWKFTTIVSFILSESKIGLFK